MKTTLQRLSTLFWLNRQRSQAGKAGIYLRITIDRKRTELFTQHYVHERAWDSKQQLVPPNASDADFINGELLILKAAFLKQYNVFKALGKNPTAEQLKNAHLGKSEQQYTVKQLFGFYIQRFREKVKIEQFNDVRNLNQNVSKPVLHISLSLSLGETVTREQMVGMSRDCAKA